MCAAIGVYLYSHCMALIVLIGVTVPIVSCTVKYFGVLKGHSAWEYIFCIHFGICSWFIERRLWWRGMIAVRLVNIEVQRTWKEVVVTNLRHSARKDSS
jgi:hypothetical protein